VRITTEQRAVNENRIRAAIDRLLRGEIPPDGSCDIKTLAAEAGIDRTAFYGSRPYAHLREEFETRLARLREADQIPDQRETQITRLKQEITTLQQRLAEREDSISELTEFKTTALSRLAAQHDEIIRLRQHAEQSQRVRHLPNRSPVIGPCS
jgi:DNA repair exonuclease SbcCD ATPase subunit